jgi:hypothetical protein
VKVLKQLGIPVVAVVTIASVAILLWVYFPRSTYWDDRDTVIANGTVIEVKNNDHIWVNRLVEVTFTSTQAFVLSNLEDNNQQQNGILAESEGKSVYTITFLMEDEWKLTSKVKVNMTTFESESVLIRIHKKIR